MEYLFFKEYGTIILDAGQRHPISGYFVCAGFVMFCLSFFITFLKRFWPVVLVLSLDVGGFFIGVLQLHSQQLEEAQFEQWRFAVVLFWFGIAFAGGWCQLMDQELRKTEPRRRTKR